MSSGLYYEGVFLSNRFSGRGILISEDDTTYDGEFASECTATEASLVHVLTFWSISHVFLTYFGV